MCEFVHLCVCPSLLGVGREVLLAFLCNVCADALRFGGLASGFALEGAGSK